MGNTTRVIYIGTRPLWEMIPYRLREVENDGNQTILSGKQERSFKKTNIRPYPGWWRGETVLWG